MKTITRWDHLSEFGIVPLTGESCGLGYRMLCDVTAKGKNSPGEVPRHSRLAVCPTNWNTGQRGRAARRQHHAGAGAARAHRCLRSAGERLQGGLEGREPGGAWHPVQRPAGYRRIPQEMARRREPCAGLPIVARPATAMSTSCPAACSNQFVNLILKGKSMNATATSESTPSGGNSAHTAGKGKAAARRCISGRTGSS